MEERWIGPPMGKTWWRQIPSENSGGLHPNTHNPCFYNHVFDYIVLRFHLLSGLVTTLNHCNSVCRDYFVDPQKKSNSPVSLPFDSLVILSTICMILMSHPYSFFVKFNHELRKCVALPTSFSSPQPYNIFSKNNLMLNDLVFSLLWWSPPKESPQRSTGGSPSSNVISCRLGVFSCTHSSSLIAHVLFIRFKGLVLHHYTHGLKSPSSSFPPIHLRNQWKKWDLCHFFFPFYHN